MITRHDILQWNMGCGQHATVASEIEASRINILLTLIKDHAPTVCAIQEAPPKIHSMLRAEGFSVHSVGRLALGMLNSAWPKGKAVIRENRILTMRFQLSAYRFVLISNVHLISRLNTEQSKRDDDARMVLSYLENVRRRWATSKCRVSEMVVGDFNVNPYDDIMMQKTGFFGNRSKAYVRKTAKNTILPHRPMYNPSWHVYGRSDEPLGSIYSTNPIDGPWLVFDQVLMSEDLAGAGSQTVSLITATKSGSVNLLSPQVRKPNSNIGSDHLPVLSSIYV